jgi:hypothetical protein
MSLIRYIIFIVLVSGIQSVFAEKIDPNKVQLGHYIHKELPPALLARIKATTDTFEIVDGITYEQSVDLYKRDLDPESNLVIWEEMARAYKVFCQSRCKTAAERKDVYRALLLRSMYSEQETLSNFKPEVITESEAKSIISQYKLDAKPIDVYQE